MRWRLKAPAATRWTLWQRQGRPLLPTWPSSWTAGTPSCTNRALFVACADRLLQRTSWDIADPIESAVLISDHSDDGVPLTDADWEIVVIAGKGILSTSTWRRSGGTTRRRRGSLCKFHARCVAC